MSEQKIRLSIGFTPRTETVISKEASRRGITFADQVRRITDAWADTIEEAGKPREKIVVMDRGQLIPTR